MAMKRFEIETDSGIVEVWAERIHGDLWFHFNGQTHVLEQAGTRVRGRTGTGVTHPGQVMAPMPGKITKIFVRPGDKVELDQPVVVMEAMKMEYSLASNSKGAVQEVNCKVGDQVALNKLLVKISPEAGHE